MPYNTNYFSKLVWPSIFRRVLDVCHLRMLHLIWRGMEAYKMSFSALALSFFFLCRRWLQIRNSAWLRCKEMHISLCHRRKNMTKKAKIRGFSVVWWLFDKNTSVNSISHHTTLPLSTVFSSGEFESKFIT